MCLLLVAIWLLRYIPVRLRSLRSSIARLTTHVIFTESAQCSVQRTGKDCHPMAAWTALARYYGRFPRSIPAPPYCWSDRRDLHSHHCSKGGSPELHKQEGFSLHFLQGVCDLEMLFTSKFAGFPGSVHDVPVRVLRRSSLMNEVEADLSMFLQNSHLIGDSAYPLRNWLMVPFKDNGNLTQAQQQYNRRLSSARLVIERAFALLKGRFRHLKMMDVRDMFLLCSVVVASCVLHNLCLLNEDYAEEFLEPIEENDDEPPDDEDFPGVSADEKWQTLVRQFTGKAA